MITIVARTSTIRIHIHLSGDRKPALIPMQPETSQPTLRATHQAVLAVSPHPDDVELGCFGTLAAYSDRGHAVYILVMTDGGRGGNAILRRTECIESAALIGATVRFFDIPDCKVNEDFEIIERIESLLSEVQPGIVFGPSPRDSHQDHRNTALAIVSATRTYPDQVYLYQTPSTTVQFAPTCYRDITDYLHLKTKAVRIHTSQSDKYYTADAAIEALASYRAFQTGNVGRYFESFEVARLIYR